MTDDSRRDDARAVTLRVNVGEVTLNVQRAGSGPPVLLLHGFPDSLHLWREVAPRIAQGGYTVIVPDLRGFGASEAPAGRRHYTLQRIVADLTGLLDSLGIDDAVRVVGHDWGAVAGWSLAMAYPERVRCGVAISVGHPREYAVAGLEQKRKGFYTIRWQVPRITEAALSRNNFASLRDWLADNPDREACLRDLSRPGRLTAGLNWYRANALRVLFGSWPQCRVPMLGIWSSRDHCLAEDQMKRSARQMAAPWRYERIEGAAHWLPLEEPERVSRLVLDWFASCAG